MSRAGMNDDRIAELDFNWKSFPEEEQAAFQFTRKLTLEPHLLDRQDIENLQQHFTDPQIVEMVQTVAGYNSTTRWTDALGLPQDQSFHGETARLNSETSPQFENSVSTVAVTAEPVRQGLEAASFVEEQLTRCRTRAATVSLGDPAWLDETTTEIAKQLGVANYARALAYLPTTAKNQFQLLQGIVNDGQLPNQLKAKIMWAVARENRGWYVAGFAQRWLRQLGLTDDVIFRIDNDESLANPDEQLAIAFARKLTSRPRHITDFDIQKLREHFSNHQVAEIVYMTGFSNMFSHFAESLQLPLEN